jgi:hypothetical protein
MPIVDFNWIEHSQSFEANELDFVIILVVMLIAKKTMIL